MKPLLTALETVGAIGTRLRGGFKIALNIFGQPLTMQIGSSAAVPISCPLALYAVPPSPRPRSCISWMGCSRRKHHSERVRIQFYGIRPCHLTSFYLMLPPSLILGDRPSCLHPEPSGIANSHPHDEKKGYRRGRAHKVHGWLVRFRSLI
jgi:hypothetical protein